jgi:2-polyprenyl-3-methyl-5-hydroxy-6-metoxy-1,4-benzoquinol methylase
MERQNQNLLEESCLFCDPGKHGQSHWVILRSDNFYLFAGLGAIIEGYVIIAPYRCDNPDFPAKSLAELSPDRIDELAFLRNLVSRFHHDTYGGPGAAFEHGRAGVCTPSSGGTLHCYHAHLCCYPALPHHRNDLIDSELHEAFGHLKRVVLVNGLHEIADATQGAPYLFFEKTDAHRKDSMVFLLPHDHALQSQALRRVFATAAGKDDQWDWSQFPNPESSENCSRTFSSWLKQQTDLAIQTNNGTAPTIDFRKSVRLRNLNGNETIAEQFHNRWSGSLQFHSLGRFLSELPRHDDVDVEPSSLRILDVGTGTGLYARVFAELGFECVAVDSSTKMLKYAKQHTEDRVTLELKSLPEDKLTGTFDGIWTSALLLHFPRCEARTLLSTLADSLRRNGLLYLSTRQGTGVDFRPEGRTFFLYNEAELRQLSDFVRLDIIDSWTSQTHRGTTGDQQTRSWQHLLLRKRER